jgi:thioredoxin-like negative regulator of GroEL
MNALTESARWGILETLSAWGEDPAAVKARRNTSRQLFDKYIVKIN